MIRELPHRKGYADEEEAVLDRRSRIDRDRKNDFREGNVLRTGTLIGRGRVKEDVVDIDYVYKIGGGNFLEKGGK